MSVFKSRFHHEKESKQKKDNQITNQIIFDSLVSVGYYLFARINENC